MEANNQESSIRPKVSDARLLAQRFHNIFPSLSEEEVWKNAFQVTQSPKKDHYKKLFLNMQDASSQTPETQKDFAGMFAAGYDIEHIALFIKAPSEAKYAETTKEDYLRLWNKENNFVAKERNQKTRITNTASAVPLLTTIAGSVIFFSGLAVGYAVNDQAIIDTAQILSGWSFGPVREVGGAVQTSTAGNIVSASLSTLGLVMVSLSLKKKAEEFEGNELQEKLGSLENGTEKDRLFAKLKETPKQTQRLLSHFTSEELALFLVSSDQTRENIWRARPPSVDQRLAAGRLEKVLWLGARLSQEINIACSSWENEVAPVNLKENLIRLRAQKDKPNIPASVAPTP